MNRREALAALVALPHVQRIAVAQPEPDDVIVVETDGRLSMSGIQNIKIVIGRIWPHRKCLVLDGGTRIRFAKQ